jgi:hypothetical protein
VARGVFGSTSGPSSNRVPGWVASGRFASDTLGRAGRGRERIAPPSLAQQRARLARLSAGNAAAPRKQREGPEQGGWGKQRPFVTGSALPREVPSVPWEPLERGRRNRRKKPHPYHPGGLLYHARSVLRPPRRLVHQQARAQASTRSSWSPSRQCS